MTCEGRLGVEKVGGWREQGAAVLGVVSDALGYDRSRPTQACAVPNTAPACRPQ